MSLSKLWILSWCNENWIQQKFWKFCHVLCLFVLQNSKWDWKSHSKIDLSNIGASKNARNEMQAMTSQGHCEIMWSLWTHPALYAISFNQLLVQGKVFPSLKFRWVGCLDWKKSFRCGTLRLSINIDLIQLNRY